MSTESENLIAFSKLVPYPVFGVDSLSGIKYCCWNGFVLPRSIALSIVNRKWFQYYIGSSLSNTCIDDFNTLVDNGIIVGESLKLNSHRDGGTLVRNAEYELSRSHGFHDIILNTSPKEVFSWFME